MIKIKAIKIAMVNKNINNITLANKLNMNVNTISRWINGNNLEQIDKFLDMLIILDIDITDIKK